MKMMCLALSLLFMTHLNAETKIYEVTENTGINKKERIDSIEKYLLDLSKSIKTMEAKLEENEKRFKNLDEIVKAMKTQAAMEAAKKLGEGPDLSKSGNPEIVKLKAEIDGLKSKEIEKLKTEVQGLTDTVKSIQLIMKSQKF